MAYKTVTKIDQMIENYRSEVSKEKNREITINEVLKLMGEHADISINTAKQLKYSVIQPSLAVAIRIADFFKVNVEDIWTVEYYENKHIEESKEKVTEKKKKKEKQKCKHENCHRSAIARGLCNKHYQNFRNHNLEKFNNERQDKCSVEDCNNPYHAKGFCSYHYNKHYRESRS